MSTFISYSRINADFAVRLAQDLKSVGMDVWLDQLDIPTGARWDDEIEKALEASSTFLIILSPQSIQSQNVKDEIGYAIDTGKDILPVVIENCKVPFRLRRFQYVDFTGEPYEQSLTKIKYLLGDRKTLASAQKNVDESKTVDDETPGVVLVPSQEPPTLDAKPIPSTLFIMRTLSRKSNLWVLLSVASLIMIVLGILFRDSIIVEEPNPTLKVTSTASIPVLPLVPTSGTFTSIPPSETSTPHPPTATLRAELTDMSGTVMRLVPAGEFIMGSKNGSLDEQPEHIVYLDAFYIDMYEVTNKLYKLCVDAAFCPPLKNPTSATRKNYYNNTQYENYPVIFVDWGMANSYCTWREARLPTEAEWEKAARGNKQYTYSWGEVADCNHTNFAGCFGDTIPVGSYENGKSVYGVFDMAGNVWEWVADWYSEDYYNDTLSTNNPAGPGIGKFRVLRGGAWNDTAIEIRAANRYKGDPSDFNRFTGFRCAKDMTP